MAVAHRIRVNGKGKTEVKGLTPKKAIIAHCKECMGFNSAEVRRCKSELCALFPFRNHGLQKPRLKIALKRQLRNGDQ